MNFIHRVLTAILGSEQDFTFEERLVLSYIFYGGFTCFISIFFNIGLGLNRGSVILVVFSFLFFTYIYILGRFKKKAKIVRLSFSIYSLLFCNFYWYVNYGSKGSAMYVFLIYFFIMIFVWESIRIWTIGSLILLNVSALFIIELVYPYLILAYPNECARITDTYLTLMIVLGFFSIIIISAKNNYIKQYKLAQQSDRLKSAFLANMSHEIRTPLNAIMGFTQLLATRDLPKDKKALYAGLVTENSQHLMQLVSDILDISLIETGQFKIRKRIVDFSDLCTKLYYTFKKVLEETGKTNVQIIKDLPSMSVTMEIDDVRLEQVLSNLLSNAAKFTEEGYIKFGYTRLDEEILFYVEDTGSGIKEEFQPLIFSRFVKNEDMREDHFSRGAGIGLSLSKDLVEILNSKIWFVSEYHKGTTFYVSIPHKKQAFDGINSKV